MKITNLCIDRTKIQKYYLSWETIQLLFIGWLHSLPFSDKLPVQQGLQLMQNIYAKSSRCSYKFHLKEMQENWSLP